MIKLLAKNLKGDQASGRAISYALFDDDKEIGLLQIRLKPSHSPKVPNDFASHIYYEIKPIFRNKGYGRKILELGLQEVKKLGLGKVVLTCDENNRASRKIIETNGGIFKDDCVLLSGEKFLKYEIPI
jgi:predicted acetyltransferase